MADQEVSVTFKFQVTDEKALRETYEEVLTVTFDVAEVVAERVAKTASLVDVIKAVITEDIVDNGGWLNIGLERIS